MTIGGITSDVDESQPQARRRPWVIAHVGGLTLVALWTIWFAMSVWAAPTRVSGDDMMSAATSGEIHDVVRIAEAPGTLSGTTLFPLAGQGTPEPSADGAYLLWTTASGQRHYAQILSVGQIEVDPSVKDDSPDAQVVAYVQKRAHHDTGIDVNWTGVAQMVLIFATLGGILASRPRKGTRWFWFWIISVPMGMGIVAYAITEHLRDPGPGIERRNGWVGLIYAIGWSVAIVVLVSVGQALFARL